MEINNFSKNSVLHLKHINSILRVIRDVNQLIVSNNDAAKLIRETCKIITKKEGFLNSWIVLFNDKQKLIDAVESGIGDKFPQNMENLLRDNKLNCIDLCTKSKQVIIINDPKTECFSCPLTENYQGRSAMSCSLQYNGILYGTLTVSIIKAYSHDEETLLLLKEMSDDLGYALHKIELTKEHEKLIEALKERENNFYDLLNNSPDAIILANQKGQHLFVNEQACKLTGYSKAELLKMNGLQLTRPADIPELKKRMKQQRLSKTHKNNQFEKIIVRKDGTEITTLYSTSVSQWNGEKLPMASFRDISELKRISNYLQESQKQYKALFNVRGDAAFVHELKEEGFGRFFEVNDVACNRLGYSREELLEMTPADISSAEDSQKRGSAQFRKRIEKKGTQIFEATHLTKHKQKIPVEILSTPILYHGKKAILSLARDMSDRKNAERQLAHSEEKFRMVFHSSPDPMSISEMETGIYVDVNQAFCVLSGYSREELLGKSVFEINIWAEEQDRKNMIAQIKKYGQVSNMEVRFQSKAGKSEHALISSNIIHIDGKPHLFSITKIIEDIRQAKQKIIDLNEELEQKVEKRTMELETSNNNLESFAYSISHDLRAPLRHIAGFSGLLKKEIEKQGKNAPYYFDKIFSSVNRMQIMIDELLSFSRIGRTELNKELLNPNVIIDLVREELKEEMNGRTIQWEIGDLPHIFADAGLVQNIFLNLIANAIKFTRNNELAIISIGGKKKDDSVEIYIHDNGVGFDPAYADKLFKVFHRLHSDDEFPGSGIGLANVKRIVDLHHGKVKAEGVLNKGATFYIYLPHK